MWYLLLTIHCNFNHVDLVVSAKTVFILIDQLFFRGSLLLRVASSVGNSSCAVVLSRLLVFKVVICVIMC